MFVDGKEYRSIWLDESNNGVVRVIDQQKLPFFFETKELRSVEDVYSAIRDMTVRGAPLIGAAGAFGIYFATLEINSRTDIQDHLANAARYLISCRPTAVNLSWGVNFVLDRLKKTNEPEMLPETALNAALEICEMETQNCKKIGEFGSVLIEEISRKKNGKKVNILTHCNAGWLACIDFGTATAPIYMANKKGIDLHVWVDETRPLNQGARLTAWELGKEEIPYTVITDNSGGYLMQKGFVDMVLVGSDRTTSRGDVANKIGTYLKALAASDNKIPFYVALPSSSFDLSIADGLTSIQIEERDAEEVTHVSGLSGGEIRSVLVCPRDASAGNWGFDITPSRLITSFITEKGICGANEKEITKLISDKID